MSSPKSIQSQDTCYFHRQDLSKSHPIFVLKALFGSFSEMNPQLPECSVFPQILHPRNRRILLQCSVCTEIAQYTNIYLKTFRSLEQLHVEQQKISVLTLWNTIWVEIIFISELGTNKILWDTSRERSVPLNEIVWTKLTIDINSRNLRYVQTPSLYMRQREKFWCASVTFHLRFRANDGHGGHPASILT